MGLCVTYMINCMYIPSFECMQNLESLDLNLNCLFSQLQNLLMFKKMLLRKNSEWSLYLYRLKSMWSLSSFVVFLKMYKLLNVC
jgi:hypothetical protein